MKPWVILCYGHLTPVGNSGILQFVEVSLIHQPQVRKQYLPFYLDGFQSTERVDLDGELAEEGRPDANIPEKLGTQSERDNEAAM